MLIISLKKTDDYLSFIAILFYFVYDIKLDIAKLSKSLRVLWGELLLIRCNIVANFC